jgi:hypothetical protein
MKDAPKFPVLLSDRNKSASLMHVKHPSRRDPAGEKHRSCRRQLMKIQQKQRHLVVTLFGG